MVCVGEADAVIHEREEACDERREGEGAFPEGPIQESTSTDRQLKDEDDGREERGVLLGEERADEEDGADRPRALLPRPRGRDIAGERAEEEYERQEQVSTGDIVHGYARDRVHSEERGGGEGEECARGLLVIVERGALERADQEEDEEGCDDVQREVPGVVHHDGFGVDLLSERVSEGEREGKQRAVLDEVWQRRHRSWVCEVP